MTMRKENEMIKAAGTARNRKIQTEKKLKQFEDMMSGAHVDYSALVMTSTGKFSAVKTDKLISELIGCIDDQRELAMYRIEKSRILDNKIKEELKNLNQPLTEEQKKFYSCYFYLLLGISLYKNDHSSFFDREEIDGTWGALLKHCRYTMLYYDPSDLFKDIILLLERPSAELVNERRMGIVYDILCVYRYITGNFITELFTEDERSEAYKRMDEEQKKIYDDPSKIDPMLEEYFWGTFEICTPEEMLREGHLYETAQHPKDPFSLNLPVLRDNGIESWSKFFTNKKRLKASCGVVLRGIFDKSVAGDLDINNSGDSTVTSAVEFYMAQKGYSVYLDDERIFPAYTYLNKAYQAASEHNKGE